MVARSETTISMSVDADVGLRSTSLELFLHHVVLPMTCYALVSQIMSTPTNCKIFFLQFVSQLIQVAMLCLPRHSSMTFFFERVFSILSVACCISNYLQRVPRILVHIFIIIIIIINLSGTILDMMTYPALFKSTDV